MIIGISGKMQSGKNTVASLIQYLSTRPDMTYSSFLLLSKQEQRYNWKQVAFATKIKQIVSILTGISVEDLERQEIKDSKLSDEWIRYGYANGFYKYYKDGKEETVMNNTQCDKKRYELEFRTNYQTAYKVHPTYREMLQYIGTNLLRDKFHNDTWVNALFADYKKEGGFEGGERTASDGGYYSTPSYKGEFPNWIITDVRFPNELEAVKQREGITIRVNRYVGEVVMYTPRYSPPKEHSSETALDDATFDYTIDNNGTIEELIKKVKEVLIKEKII